jgi:hypothetical protein
VLLTILKQRQFSQLRRNGTIHKIEEKILSEVKEGFKCVRLWSHQVDASTFSVFKSYMEARTSVSNEVNDPKTVGMVPVIWFCCAENERRLEMFPISSGICPVKLFSFKVRNSAIEKPLG